MENNIATPPYSVAQEQVAAIAKALSHPARVFILQFLGQQHGCFVGKLAEELPMANSSLSQHLTALKNAGLIDAELMPPRIKYTINAEKWEEANRLFEKFFTKHGN